MLNYYIYIYISISIYIYIYIYINIVKYFAFFTETDEASVKKAKHFTKYMCF